MFVSVFECVHVPVCVSYHTSVDTKRQPSASKHERRRKRDEEEAEKEEGENKAALSLPSNYKRQSGY